MGEPARNHLRLVSENLPENLQRRSNGIFYGRIEVDGTPLRKSLGTRDVVEAQEKLRRWLAEVSPRHASGELTFAQVASSWITAFKPTYTEKTWRRYKTSLKMLKPFFDGLLWVDVTRTKINEFITARKDAGATTATVNRDLSVLSNIIEHALDQEWCEENPMVHLGKKKRKEKRDPFVLPTDEMIEHVWNHTHGTFADLCRFALETGMRLDEIAPLDKKLNLRGATIQLFKTKNHRVRVVNLTDTAVEIVARQPGESGLLFRTRAGTAYKNVSTMWRDLQKRAAKSWSSQHPSQPFIHFRFHDLRHIYAIRYLRSGGNIYVLQKQLGHSTIRQTEAYLDHLTPEEQMAAQTGSSQ
jgi:integrase/recombinase XerD